MTVPELRWQSPRLAVGVLAAGRANADPGATARGKIAAVLTPAVLEHLPEPLKLQTGPDPVAAWVRARQTEGFLYTVHEIRTDTLTGLMILADTSAFDGRPTVRLGYMLVQSSWGQGFATELVTGFVRALGASGWQGQVLAGVSVANPGSSRVLIKAGFDELPAAQTDVRSFRFELP